MFRYYVSVQFCLQGYARNDLYCVGQNVKPFSLTYLRLVAATA